ncbi:hypothetical protein ES332_D09G058500v1 [Gossypium tomentosum]|uniref:Uncharacterized protein n=1 Tax=Gossypium tomentosum TaxID=34277 RepID=A0A5D2JDH7_GOSTO|nr:hypothetical protein ES332_D09G058500v1 [Gossypium tomentosum]
MDAIHTFAREGELDNLLKCIESGVSVHLQDSEGRTPMHWAVDRGHLKIAEALLSRNADVNAMVIIVSLLRFYRFYSSESDSPVEKKPDPIIESASIAEAHVKDVALLVEDLKTRNKKYFEGDEEALPSVLEAILQRKLAGKHEETDDELMDELEVQPRDDVDDEEFESDFDNLYSTDEEILAILTMFLMK